MFRRTIFIGQLTVAPLTDRTVGVGRPRTSESDNLAHLLGSELRRGAALWRVCQPFGHTDFLERHLPKLQPAPSPVAGGFVINAEFPSNLQVVQAVACCQHNRARKASCWPVVNARTCTSNYGRGQRQSAMANSALIPRGAQAELE